MEELDLIYRVTIKKQTIEINSSHSKYISNESDMSKS